MSRWRLGRKDDEYPGSEPVSRSTVRKMEREYRSEHPTRTQSFVRHVKQGMNERALDRRILHAKEKEVHRTAFEAGRIERAKERGFERGRGYRPSQRLQRASHAEYYPAHHRRPRARVRTVYIKRKAPLRRQRIRVVQPDQGSYQLDFMSGRQVWVPYRRK